MKKLLIALLLLELSCTGYQAFRSGEKAEKSRDYDVAVADYLGALAKDPDNVRFRINLERAKLRASQFHFENGKQLHAARQYPGAILEYQMAVQLDPNNQFASDQLARAQKEYAETRASLSDLDQEKQDAAKKPPQIPKLDPKSKAPLSFSFPKPTEFQDICKAVAKAFGFNVLFDAQLKEKKVTVELQDVNPEQALDNLMQVGGCFYKVLDESSIIVVPDTQQNRRAYEDLVIQTFYLSNGDVKDVSTVLRAIIDAKRMGINQQLNAIVLRDGVDKVALAQKIIESNDKAKAEVLLNVELLQVNTNKLKEFGAELGSYAYSLAYTGGTGSTEGSSGSTVSLGNIDLKRDNWSLSIPNITFHLLKNSSEAESLAQPQLRISEGEKASLHIGDRVPIVTASFQGYNQGATTGYNYMPYNSYQYTDVGIKIDIEPRIHHNREVTLKLKVEVSNVSGEVDMGNGQKVPQISTRTIQSVIRLRDGETNLLAGLLQTTRTSGKSGFPWLQDLPLIGSLFSTQNKKENRTDLILSVTPQIIRMPDISDEDLLPIWAGTEDNISMKGSSSRVTSDSQGPFDGEAAAAPPPEKQKNPEDRSEPSDRVRPVVPGGGRRVPTSIRPGGASATQPSGTQNMLPAFGFTPGAIQGTVGQTFTVNLTGEGEGFTRGSVVVAFNPAEVAVDRVDPFPGVTITSTPLEPGRVRIDFTLPEGAADLATLRGTFLAGAETTLAIVEGAVFDARDDQWPVEAFPAILHAVKP